MVRMLSAVVVLASVIGCGPGVESAADECAIGDQKCDGDRIMYCNQDINDPSSRQLQFLELEDCSDNVDTGRTTCGLFDGDPICEEPATAG